MKKVIWTPTSRISLQHTYDFLAELWNEQVAEEFGTVEDLAKKF